MKRAGHVCRGRKDQPACTFILVIAQLSSVTWVTETVADAAVEAKV